MKVIKVGTSSQSRIAQACDRCRSKKIRCDGIRPTCSQCANVGFECKTSDKLSRRAFPRGYTESLEERVRQLETEVRELKDLLDEKDEKIDMLSRLYGKRPTPPVHSPVSEKRDVPASQPKEDTFRVQASPLLLGVENSDSYFMGGSSGRSFIGSYRSSTSCVCGLIADLLQNLSRGNYRRTESRAPTLTQRLSSTSRAALPSRIARLIILRGSPRACSRTDVSMSTSRNGRRSSLSCTSPRSFASTRSSSPTLKRSRAATN